MSIDLEEAKREEAWHEAWRESAKDQHLDPDDEDGHVLDLIWDGAAKLMTEWGVPLPKSVTQSNVEQ
ncbi:hypothetical protein L0Z31_09300 [Burkholderia vietnamiensis]|uniref:hypothetical protein n=1 Tax=Burkholderia vietnamiensis TaxID=60552 RepID=UPI00075AA926|nr:hypothetical protein [Burkholderia vietnamiensis]KVS12753.1 hypothetical protein WK32_32705 [Burkholderia vietnamiensis]MCO1351651.1 hypothetical protein [Burkholderia vietnamiensis]MCO1430157.1 hypothetical protein [Burkholderia vietnamiensis]UQN50940.1 hypothetical protein L0Y95_29315 [Burkholderia vietnamiensis]HDR9036945.1 hypothetical protein [Burkholderia vietnamiensis]